MLIQAIKRKLISNKYHVSLVALILLMVAFIESRQPFFFLQDDNRSLYLPFYVHNMRALLGGEFPLYNFHQYLGTPVTIQYATLYPINYIGLWLSKLLFGNYFGAMEFIATFHLIIACLGFYCLTRFLKLREVSCFFGSIAWVFCGSVLITGNSWIQTVGYAAYIPWILLFAIKLMYHFDVKNFSILVVLKVCALLLGNPQLFVYTITFEFLTVTLLFLVTKSGTGSVVAFPSNDYSFPRSNIIKFMSSVIANYLCVFIITMPLILQTLQQAAVSSSRKQLLLWDEYAAHSLKVYHWLHGLFTPFGAVAIPTQFELDFTPHIGYLTLVCILIYVLGFKNRVDRAHSLVFCLLAIFSFLWASDILVAKLIYQIPFYNRMRFPFRVALFTSFYLVIISAFGFDIFYNKILSANKYSRKIIGIIIAVLLLLHSANFLLYYTTSPQRMFSRHFDKVPLSEHLSEQLTDGRIVSAGLDDVWDGEKIVPGFSAPMLGFNYATLWGLFHFGGYDALVSEKAQVAALGIKNNPVFNLTADEPFKILPDTLEYFRKWGVKWYVVDRKIPLGNDSPFRLYYNDKHRQVIMDPLAKPFVYWREAHSNSDRITCKFNTNSVDITSVCETGGMVIVNVLFHPFFTAQLDGNELLINETSDNQVSLRVPEGQHKIILKYTDKNFFYGSLVSAVFTLLLSSGFLFYRYKLRQRQIKG